MFLNKNEKYICHILKQSGKREYMQLQIAYIIQMFIIMLFLMFAIGIENITNESLSDSDLQQIIGILSSVVLVAVITIIFFQWILSMQISALYDIRRQFNKGLLRMGTARIKLGKIYFHEWMGVQGKCIVAGVVLGEVIYIALALLLELEEKIVPVWLVGISILFYIILGSVFFIFQSYLNLKGSTTTRRTKKVMYFSRRKLFICLGIAMLLIIITYVGAHYIESRQLRELVKGIYIVALLILYDPVINILHLLIAKICRKFHKNFLFIANRIAQGYFKQLKVVGMFMILSGILFIGLHTMYNMVREAGYDVVQENVRYKAVSIYPELRENAEPDKFEFYGFSLKGETDSGTNVWLKGIDAVYRNEFEQFNIVSGYEPAMKTICGEVQNGILFPEFYANPSDVGKEIQIYVDGEPHIFKVIGLYYTNDFGKLNCLVNNEYLAQEFGVETGQYNTVYSLDAVRTDEFTESKNDVAKNSRNKAVGGTELIEAITYILIACALLSLLIYYGLISKNTKKDIIRFKAMGISNEKIRRIYLYHAVTPILFSGIFLFIGVRIFVERSTRVMLDSYYFKGVKYNEIRMEILILVLFIVFSIIVQWLQIKKSINSDKLTYVLKEYE